MTPLARTVLLLLAAFCGPAWAQDGRVAFVSSGLVAFTLTPEAFAAAAACPGCTVTAPDPGPPIAFTVTRQNPNRIYTIDVSHDGWGPAPDLALEARYQVSSADGGTVILATDWQPLTMAPTALFDQTATPGRSRVHVDVAYRLVLSGSEPAGTFLTRVTHAVRENGSAIVHDVQVTLPSYLTLRLDGRVLPVASTTVAFDYAAAPNAYLQAVGSGTPLPPTASDLYRLEVSTNHGSGYTVTVRVVDALAASGLRDRLWLAGAPAHERRFTSTAPTAGFVTLLAGTDFSLRVDGSEGPGAYLFVVSYEAVPNP